MFHWNKLFCQKNNPCLKYPSIILFHEYASASDDSKNTSEYHQLYNLFHNTYFYIIVLLLFSTDDAHSEMFFPLTIGIYYQELAFVFMLACSKMQNSQPHFSCFYRTRVFGHWVRHSASCFDLKLLQISCSWDLFLSHSASQTRDFYRYNANFSFHWISFIFPELLFRVYVTEVVRSPLKPRAKCVQSLDIP